MTTIDSAHRSTSLVPSRRQVVGVGLWAVPAVALVTSTPAFASASETSVVSVRSADGNIPATGATPLTVTVRDSAGQPRVGAPVSLTAPTNAVLGASDGVTGGDGTFTTTLDLQRPGAKPGSTVTVTALSGSDSGIATLTVLGANALGWGPNGAGQAGSPSGGSALLTPSQASRAFPSPVVSMASSGAGSGFAVLADGSVWTVGDARWGLRGPGETGSTTWTRFAALSDVKQLVASGGAAFALKQDGSLWSWGSAAMGCRGDGSYASSGGTSADSDTPVKILDGVIDVAAGDTTAYALLSTGKVMGWGSNYQGAVGDGSTTDRPQPVEVSGLEKVVQVAAQYNGGYALDADGKVWAWGRNELGQGGNGTATPAQLTPVQVPLPKAATQVVGAGDTAYALLTDKTVRAWGRNDFGQVGDGTGGSWDPIEKRRQLSPVAVSGLANVKQVASTTETAYALDDEGAVWSWGINRNGEIGDGTTGTANNRLTPVKVQGLDGYAVTKLCPVNGGGQGRNPFAITAEATVVVDAVEYVPAGVPGDVAVKVAAGAKAIAGASVSLSATTNASLGTTSATTGSDGFVRTTVTADAQTWPGTVVRVDAATSSNAGFDTVTVLGANALGWGPNAEGQAGSPSGGSALLTPTQASRAFPSPVVSMTSSGAGSAFALLTDGSVWTVGESRWGLRGRGITGASTTWTPMAGISDVKQLVASGGAAFALKRDGSLWSWGSAAMGCRGDGSYASSGGTSADSDTPAKILSGVVDVAAGDTTAYALLSTGKVMGWGNNYQGAVGDGTTGDERPEPVMVVGLSGIVQISAQYNGGYALDADGKVWAWGRNELGQGGNGTATAAQPVPVQVTLPMAATQVVGAGDTGYALLTDKTVRAWGRNDFGQVGDGNGGSWDPIEKRQQLTPVPVSNLTNVKQVASTTETAYALDNDGTVWSWGINRNGEIGDGTTGTANNRLAPVKVQGLDGYAITRLCPVNGGGQGRNPFAITAQSTIALTADASVVAGGAVSTVTAKVASGSKPLPAANVSFTASPGVTLSASSGQTNAQGLYTVGVTVPDVRTWPGTVERVSAASGSGSASATLTVLGANALGWGPNGAGQAGSPSGGSALLTPTQASRAFPSPVVSMTSSGAGSGFALLANGSVWTVGDARWGLRGPGETGSTTWTRFTALSDVKQLVASGGAAFALKRDGSLWSWGSAGKGVRGDGSYASSGGTSADSDTPAKILEGVVDVAAGDSSAYALLSNGKVMAWGWNFNGTLGDGTTTDSPSPVQVRDLTDVAQIAAQYVGGYALKNDGSVWAWGRNVLGQCGNGTSTEGELKPVQVTLPMRATQVVAGGDTAYAVLSDGTVRAWGRNDFGQVGDGTGGSWDPIEQRRQLTPVVVSSLSQVVQVCATTESAFALTSDGTVWSWGINRNGEIGDGTTGTANNRLTPVRVQGLDGYAITGLTPRNGGGQARNPFALFRR